MEDIQIVGVSDEFVAATGLETNYVRPRFAGGARDRVRAYANNITILFVEFHQVAPMLAQDTVAPGFGDPRDSIQRRAWYLSERVKEQIVDDYVEAVEDKLFSMSVSAPWELDIMECLTAAKACHTTEIIVDVRFIVTQCFSSPTTEEIRSFKRFTPT